ncbi:MAG: putative hydrophobic protein [Marmoricola sp.]|nr:putative hydrophobic protein [Marmoricola sp.]
MLHLRLRVPPDLTEEVGDLLVADGTVTNVAVLPSGFRDPAGALVLADVARESATGVVGRLRALGLEERGSIAIDEIGTLLSTEATRAEQVAPGAPDDGVVWVSVEQRLRDDSRLSWAFLAFMTLATLIAGAGRILDQPILIVGAMVVGPEFVPIAAICFALARPRLDLLPRALGALGAGFGFALVVATALWSVAYAAGAFTRTQASTGSQTDFIVSPDAWSLVVALLAGVAGTLSLTTAKSGPLVGVFISITTIPAVGTIAVCVACGTWSEAGSALVQLGVNLLGILVAGTLTLLVQRLVWHRVSGRHHARVLGS